MPTFNDITLGELPKMTSHDIEDTPEYCLPFLINLRNGWLSDVLRPITQDDITVLNIVILNLELMIAHKQNTL